MEGRGGGFGGGGAPEITIWIVLESRRRSFIIKNLWDLVLVFFKT